MYDHHTTSGPCTCTKEDAARWLDDFAELALSGDAFGLRLLPVVVEHFLRIVSGGGQRG